VPLKSLYFFVGFGAGAGVDFGPGWAVPTCPPAPDLRVVFGPVVRVAISFSPLNMTAQGRLLSALQDTADMV
jgi:hypothetical protein